MERHGHLDLDPAVRSKLLQFSAATITLRWRQDRRRLCSHPHPDRYCQRLDRMRSGLVLRCPIAFQPKILDPLVTNSFRVSGLSENAKTGSAPVMTAVENSAEIPGSPRMTAPAAQAKNDFPHCRRSILNVNKGKSWLALQDPLPPVTKTV